MISNYLKIQHLLSMMPPFRDCSPEERVLSESIIVDVLNRANSMGMPISNDTVLILMKYLGVDNFNRIAYMNGILLTDFTVRRK